MGMDRERLRTELTRHEGYRKDLYRCSEGKLTIGVGHNLDAAPLCTKAVMAQMEESGLCQAAITAQLDHDIQQCETDLDSLYPAWKELDDVRQRVLINMMFNLGSRRLAGFRNMWAAIGAGDYDRASAEMLDSRWATQVGRRAIELSEMMRTGEAA